MPKKAKWNELPCPACKEPCSNEASKCPHCQTEFTAGQLKERKGAMKAGMIGFGVLVLAVFLFFTMCSGDDAAQEVVFEEGSGPSAFPSARTEKPNVLNVFHDRIGDLMVPCDQASSAMIESAQAMIEETVSTYDAYAVASETAEWCETSSFQISQLVLPQNIPAPMGQFAKEAKEECAMAMLGKMEGSQLFMEILDGDLRPSKLQQLSALADSAETQLYSCAAALVQMKVGSESDE